MAGLFDGVFSPNTGWLGSAMPQQQQQQPDPSIWDQFLQTVRPPGGAVDNIITNTKNGMDNLGGAGNILSTVASPYNPMMWLNPAPMLGNMIAGGVRDLAQPPGGAPAPPSQGDSPREQNGAFPGMMLPGQPPQTAPQSGPTLDQRAYGSGGGGQPMQPPMTITPQSAQLPPQAAQSFAQAPQSEPNRLDAGLGSFVGNLHNGPIAAILGGLGGAVTGKRNDPYGVKQQDQQVTMQAIAQSLVSRGYSQQEAMGMARAAAIDPKVAEKVLGDAFAQPKTMEEFIARDAANRSRGAGQGQQSPTAAYEDFLRAKNRGEKAGTTEGERVANAQLDLPSAVAQANEQLRLTNELKTHKGRDNGVFWHSKVGGYLPDSAIPGNTDARDAVGILNSIKGGAFLEAFKTLKGGGQITEVEGKKATDAIARMDRSQSRSEFDKALSDYQGVIKLGVDRASQLAGQQPPNQFKGNSDWRQVSPGVRIRQVQ